MKEKLSALIDDELHEEEVASQLGRLKSDAQLRQAWDTYHLIGDTLRGEGVTDCAPAYRPAWPRSLPCSRHGSGNSAGAAPHGIRCRLLPASRRSGLWS